MNLTSGEIYFIGEKDLRSKELTRYFKVGIVRENTENASRDSTERLLEHQTGNPRELYIESVFKTELVELVETLLHKKFARLGVRGEWMMLSAGELQAVEREAGFLAQEAKEIIAEIQEADILAKTKSDDLIIPATPELVDLGEIYLESNLRLKSCEDMFLIIKTVLANALEDKNEKEEVEAFVQVQERRGKSVFAEDEFKAKYSDIYSKFLIRKSSIKGTASFSGSRSFRKPIGEFDSDLARMIEEFDPLVESIRAGNQAKQSLHEFSLELRRISAEASWSKMKAESKIKVACGIHAGIEGVFKWIRTQKETETLDKRALTEAFPELVAAYTSEGVITKAVIVDPKKGY